MIEPKESIKNMSGYFVPMFFEEYDIKIDSNENNYGPSEKVISSLASCNMKNISFYPCYGELSKKIAEHYCVELSNIKVIEFKKFDKKLNVIINFLLFTT